MQENELRLRPFIFSRDFGIISKWITKPREHAMWCAGRTKFPIEREDFTRMLEDIAENCGDSPFVATDTNGIPVGFFCYSVDPETNTGMFKFVMVDPALRGRGLGSKMLRLALSYAFGFTGAEKVDLCVLSANYGAKKCYESIGFTEMNTDENALRYEDEVWERCHMSIEKGGK